MGTNQRGNSLSGKLSRAVVVPREIVSRVVVPGEIVPGVVVLSLGRSYS